VYQLTDAQARVARELANGGGYKGVANILGISEETVRSHVKEIYPKMGVTRQSDMVRVMLSLAQVRV
jgi:DNA-binding CsgD family transcriptional regulator